MRWLLLTLLCRRALLFGPFPTFALGEYSRWAGAVFGVCILYCTVMFLGERHRKTEAVSGGG